MRSDKFLFLTIVFCGLCINQHAHAESYETYNCAGSAQGVAETCEDARRKTLKHSATAGCCVHGGYAVRSIVHRDCHPDIRCREVRTDENPGCVCWPQEPIHFSCVGCKND